MRSAARVSLAQINAADKAAFVAALGEVAEHAPWIAEATHARGPFATVSALHDAISDVIHSLDEERRLALIRAHPDLAGKAARAGAMTNDSVAEQASAGLDRLSDADFERFHRLNDAYRSRFGIPFIICVRRHSRSSILNEFERRLHNDKAEETDAALREISRIIALRLDQRIESEDRLKVQGRLSTHVLDAAAGCPAAGIPVQLFALEDDGSRTPVATATTNADGRTDAPLVSGRPVPIGPYQLEFRVDEYFRRQGPALPSPTFLDIVPIRFAVADAEGHYHVPLLVTPWSYTTYRGS
jgi:2-oxo-4-hydroxy-4-carboxy-5-ureidoimidazoline decarboxylase